MGVLEAEELNIAVIGCGRIGQRHIGHIKEQANLVAVCDTDASQLTGFQGSDLALYKDLATMLDQQSNDIDVVSVCTPNGLHAAHSIEALNAGCHVICEKPMALSVQDCGAMIEAAERANRRLFIVKQNRYNPPVAAVKQLLDEGKLGKVQSAHLNCFWNRNDDYYEETWKGTLELDGGTLFTQFSHFIDLLYWMVGDVREVAAVTGNFQHAESVEFEDAGVAVLSFYSGAIGSVAFSINSHQKNMEGSLTLFCDRGTVKIGGQYLNELEYQDIDGVKIEGLPEGGGANQYGHYQGSMSNHAAVYRNVIDVLTKGGVIATAGFEGLKTVEIIDKIYRAAGRD